MSRPEVSVVMPFAGVAGGRARRARSARIARDPRRRRADPGRQLRASRPRATARTTSPSCPPPASAPRRTRATPAPRTADRRLDPVHRRRLRAAGRTCSTRTSPSRSRTTSARWRARCARRPARRRSPRATAPRAGSSRSARTSSTRTGPRAAAANLIVRRAAFEAVGGFYEGVRAAEDTDFSWRLQQAGWRLELRPERVRRASLPRLARRAAPAVARVRRRARVAVSPLRRVRARARAGARVAARDAARRRAALRPLGGGRGEPIAVAGADRPRRVPGARRAAVGRGAGRLRALQPSRTERAHHRQARGRAARRTVPGAGRPARRTRADARGGPRRGAAPARRVRRRARAAARGRLRRGRRSGRPAAGHGARSSSATRCARGSTSPAAGPAIPGCRELAPAVRRLEHDRRARVQALGAGTSVRFADAARRGSPAASSVRVMRVAGRRSLRLHAAVRPRAVRRARAGGRAGRARHERVRVRRRPRRRTATRVREAFYRHAFGAPGSRLRAASKLLEHVPDMLRYRHGAARAADVVHFQWLSVQWLDRWLLPRAPDRAHRPRSAAARAAAGPGGSAAAAVRRRRRGRRALRVRAPAARRAARRRAGQGARHPPRRVRASGAHRGRGAAARVARRATRPAVLFFGLLRPYKGLEVLLEAWRSIGEVGAELWIVGRPRMALEPLRARAPASVRFVPRYRLRRRARGVLSPRRAGRAPVHARPSAWTSRACWRPRSRSARRRC